MARLAVERDRACAVRGPRLQVLFDLETCWALFLDDRHRPVALGAERFHRRWVERRAVGAPRERKPREDASVFGTQDDKRLRRLSIWIGRRLWCRRLAGRWPGRCRADRVARREQDLILAIERQAIAPAVLRELVRRLHLHCLGVDHRYAAWPILENLIHSALAIGDGLLGRPAEIDVAEYGPVLGVHNHKTFGRMAADVDAIVKAVAVDPVGAKSRRHFDRLDELHRFDVEHRRLRMVAREAMPGLRTHGRTIAANTSDRADRRKRVEIEDGRSFFEGRHFGARRCRRLSLRGSARDIYSPAGRVREDVIRAAFAPNLCGLEYLVRPVCLGLERQSHGRQKDKYASHEKCGSFHRTLP